MARRDGGLGRDDPRSVAAVADELRRAYDSTDLARLAPLLAPDVEWGDGDNERHCRTAEQVLATYATLADAGVTGEITALHVGPRGVACELALNWPAPADADRRASMVQVFLVSDGLVREIRGYDDRNPALAAIGISA